MVGWLIKKISPSTRIMLFAHGIEVWESLGKRKMMLVCCDKIIAVSHLQTVKLQELHGIPANAVYSIIALIHICPLHPQ